MITHHCNECGEEVTEFCEQHPNAEIASLISNDRKPSTFTKIMVDWEFNAEEFWDHFHDLDFAQTSLSDYAINACERLSRDSEVIVRTEIANEIKAFVETIPGFADGPAHAAEAINFDEIEHCTECLRANPTLAPQEASIYTKTIKLCFDCYDNQSRGAK